MAKEDKANAVLVEQRTLEIYHCLLVGKRRAEILQYVAEKKWNIETRTIDDYIRRAGVLFRKQSENQRARELGKAIERMNYLFMKTLDDKDYRTALAVQKEMGILLGLNAPTQMDVTTGGEKLSAPTVFLPAVEPEDDD